MANDWTEKFERLKLAWRKVGFGMTMKNQLKKLVYEIDSINSSEALYRIWHIERFINYAMNKNAGAKNEKFKINDTDAVNEKVLKMMQKTSGKTNECCVAGTYVFLKHNGSTYVSIKTIFTRDESKWIECAENLPKIELFTLP